MTLLDAVNSCSQEGKPFVIATLIGIRGSAPQNLGAKILVTSKGLSFGTIGGGKIENHCIEYAKTLINSQSSLLVKEKWNLQTDIGMTCGGEVEILFEPFQGESSWEVAIFGAGHVCQALVRTLLPLNIKLIVIDSRQEWLEKLPRHERLKIICDENPASLVKTLNEKAFVLSMTMGHSFDMPILINAFKQRNFPYLGVIGSKGKRNVIVKELEEAGISKEESVKLICPLGEKIGSNRPEEIAISISAQLLKFRDQLL